MSLISLRVGVTVVSFLVFLGIVAWAWSRKSQRRFNDAANSIFKE